MLHRFIPRALVAVILLLEVQPLTAEEGSGVMTWPAPPGIQASRDFEVTANGTSIFLYPVRVQEKVITNKPGIKIYTHNFNGETQWASLGLFDFTGNAEVRVKVNRPFQTVRILPASLNIPVQRSGHEVSFVINEARAVTMILDDSPVSALHLLVHRPEVNPPRRDDPGVIYFGPGLHEIDYLLPKSGQTVYLAGGAVVRTKFAPDEKMVQNQMGFSYSQPGAITLEKVNHVRIMGRGILDGQEIPHLGRSLVLMDQSRWITLEGITLIQTPSWNVDINRCADVAVNAIGIVSGRLNSDGIDTVSSQRVHVTDCFTRTHDDSLMVKAMTPGCPSEDVVYEHCTTWNDWRFSAGIGDETRADICNVVFRDIDVLANVPFVLGLPIADSGTVHNILFDNIRVESLTRVPTQWISQFFIGSEFWGTDSTRGHASAITFRNISITNHYQRAVPAITITGFDQDHEIRDVFFEGITYNGRPLSTLNELGLKTNAFVTGVKVMTNASALP